MDTADKITDNVKLRFEIVENALRHVVFDGWSKLTFDKVCLESNLPKAQINLLFPRGAIDMALAFHEKEDDQFFKSFLLCKSNNSSKRIRDRIELAINFRLEIAERNKEAVKRSIALLTTPFYLSEGSRALWRTSDKIWNSVGDSCYDLNWYSKRFILSSVYSTVLIFWLEDDSTNFIKTREFVTRRIADVMMLERIKGTIKKSPLLGQFVEQFEFLANGMIESREKFPGWQGK